MLRNIIRAAFVLLILFEVANYIKVFHFTVDFTWLGLLITSIFVFAALEIGDVVLAKKLHTVLPRAVWPLSFLAVAFDAFGDMLHFYSHWIWYDQIGHFLGGAIATLVIERIYRAVARTHEWKHPHHLSLLFALGLSTVFGVLYEIEEYLEDYFKLTSRLGDGRDTANDLLMNLLGALITILIIVYVRRSHSPSSSTTITRDF